MPSEIIWQSARWIPNFSALKAASAFEAIEKYAANLINQPWRKEYKVIKVRFKLWNIVINTTATKLVPIINEKSSFSNMEDSTNTT